MASLPKEMKALRVHEIKPNGSSIVTLPTPHPTEGSVVVKILATACGPNSLNIIEGSNPIPFSFPLPSIPGNNSIGRVVATGPDATALPEGQLVMIESFVRARDDPDVQILWGAFDGMTPESKKLHRAWRDACMAEYVRAPLENTHPLDEKRLLGPVSEGGLGYTVPELVQLPCHVVAYGGLRGINLQAGERVIVAPATGAFSGAAVNAANAMGASVVAASRNLEGLKELKRVFPRIEIVQLTGNLQDDTTAMKAFGPVDAYIDISPPAATGSNHLTAAAMAVRQYGRISLMGGRADEALPIPHMVVAFNNLTIRGQYMYERQQVRDAIKLTEAGLLKLGKEGGHEVVGTFNLDQCRDAYHMAEKHSGYGKVICVMP